MFACTFAMHCNFTTTNKRQGRDSHCRPRKPANIEREPETGSIQQRQINPKLKSQLKSLL